MPMSLFRIALALALGLMLLSGCEQGPAQKAGEKVDKGVEDAGRALEKAGEKAADKLEEAGKKIRDAAK
jgi:hypothetical protein